MSNWGLIQYKSFGNSMKLWVGHIALCSGTNLYMFWLLKSFNGLSKSNKSLSCQHLNKSFENSQMNKSGKRDRALNNDLHIDGFFVFTLLYLLHIFIFARFLENLWLIKTCLFHPENFAKFEKFHARFACYLLYSLFCAPKILHSDQIRGSCQDLEIALFLRWQEIRGILDSPPQLVANTLHIVPIW